MKIAFIGKFKKLHDEEYLARSFESLGHEILRIDERNNSTFINDNIEVFNPGLVIWTKLMVPDPKKVREFTRKYKTAAWIFDLYWGYNREYRITSHPAFTADYVFTTDNGHNEEFAKVGINHRCVRQGIYTPECYMETPKPEYDVVFVGSDNILNSDRQKKLSFIEQNYNLKWFGRLDTNEVRGKDLNTLYSKSKVVIGDSVYSPHYWSNRVVETLGRGGFLIHRDVPGLKGEYPHLVTYDGTNDDLEEKIDYYLSHETERLEIVKKNFEWVKDNYTSEKKCQELLNYIS
jgi:hypothetical protein